MADTLPEITRCVSMVAALVPLTLAGCARVEPQADYQRTGELIGERTGAAEVYDPQTEDLLEAKIDQLIEGGLTEAEAVQLALLNNRAFQAAFQGIGVSRAEVVRSSLPENPSIGISLRFPEGGGRSDLTLTFAQQLVDLWQIPVRKHIAEARLSRTILNVAHEAVVLASQTRMRYWTLRALEETTRLAEKDVKLAGRSLKLARDRFTAGEVGRLDVNLAQAALFETRQRLITLRRRTAQSRGTLARLLGVSRAGISWELSDDLPEAAQASTSTDQLLDAALSARLDVRAILSDVRAAEFETRRQMLNIFPNVTLGAELERTENRGGPGRHVLADTARSSIRSGRLTAPEIQSRGERRLERSQIIDTLLGPTLEVTLPIWHQNQPQIAKARFQATQRRKQAEDLLNAVVEEVINAAASRRAAGELMTFLEDEALPLARDNVEIARRAYQAGRAGVVVLMEAQRGLIAQRRALLDARRDYAIAEAALRQAIGGHLPEELKPTPPPTNKPTATNESAPTENAVPTNQPTPEKQP